jgi:hypothetical protein
MTECQFLRNLADIIVSHVDMKYRGFRHDVQVVGHFNGSLFMPKRMFHHVSSTFFRFLLCLAAAMTEKEFKRMMFELADYICQIADSKHFERINDEHVESVEEDNV